MNAYLDSHMLVPDWWCSLRSDNVRPGLWAVYPTGVTALGRFADMSVMEAVVDNFGNLVRVS